MKQNPMKPETLPAGLGKILVAHLIPDKKNPRKDLKKGDPEFEKINKSVEKFGQLDPIIFNTRTRKVIGGHQRLKVLDSAGYTELYTVTLGAYTWAFAEADLKELSDKEESAANIALNKAQGDWEMGQLTINLQELKLDGLLDVTGFDDKEFDAMIRELHKDDEPQDSEPQISRAEELRKEWGTELGQMWQCGDHRVICGDCTDPAVVARVMQGEKADMVETDPPYSVNYAAKNRALQTIGRSNRQTTDIEGDTLTTKETAENIWSPAFANAYENTREGGVIYCFSPQGGDQMMMMMIREKWNDRLHQLIWKKNSPTFSMGRLDYQYQHEPIHYSWKGKNHGFYGKSATSVIECNRPSSSKLHPTMKPAELIEILISNSTMAGECVLDPFLGSGTTMIACENLGRKARGIEIDPGYVAVCLQRYKDTFNKKPVLLEGD